MSSRCDVGLICFSLEEVIIIQYLLQTDLVISMKMVRKGNMPDWRERTAKHQASSRSNHQQAAQLNSIQLAFSMLFLDVFEKSQGPRNSIRKLNNSEP